MAAGIAPLSHMTRLIATEMHEAVCSVYIKRPGDILELIATEGLNPAAVGRTRLHVGEGIVGLCAASGQVMNLGDVQNHPNFAYRPEIGEEHLASMLAIPVRRAGRTLGVLTVQSRTPGQYQPEAVEELETAALLMAEILGRAGATDGSEEGVAGTVPRNFSGATLNSGIAIGPVILHRWRPIAGPLLTDDPRRELDRLNEAAERMQRGLDDLHLRLPDGTSDSAASREVLDAYRLVAADAGWMQRVADAVRDGLTAEAAVQRVSGEVHDRMRRIGDSYLRERLADLEDLAGRLLAELAGPAPSQSTATGAILLARRLGPAELLQWHAGGIAGLIVEEASPTGHAAILARALGLPALGSLRGIVTASEPGDDLILDAEEGTALLRPEAEVIRTYQRDLALRSAQACWARDQKRPAVTRDLQPIQLMLNLGLGLELDQLERTGAEGIGLFRTEIAALARGGMLDVAEQTALYKRVMDAAGDRPVVFRTLDLGADKLLPGEDQPEQDNPAMGWRSLRVGLDRPAILRQQLRALLVAAEGRPLRVMFPMVATVAEFRAARALMLSEALRVGANPAQLEIGTMLEVPSLLWQLDQLMEEADFVSVGSNDLMQFLFAADRGAPALVDRYDLLLPPVLDLLEHVRERAAAARGGRGIPVSVCGEAAGRPVEAMVLAALGFTTLSMSAASVPLVRAVLSELDLARFRHVMNLLRRTANGSSLFGPVVTWAREQGIEL